MRELPVTIRLLDPPLHEFLPREKEELEELAKNLDKDLSVIRSRSLQLEEQNPMLGHRGCRLGVTFPEIYEMQVRSIFESALDVSKKMKINIKPEIMIPLIISEKEFLFFKKLVEKIASKIEDEYGETPIYLLGTMVELPRAALNAKNIALHADFFSFGTNDLTQTTLGISRDDCSKFFPDYLENKIIENDPFVSIDIDGVGVLVKMAAEEGIKSNKMLKLGICGEHGGDPKSIDFFHNTGLQYVSCSPYRVPIARLAAAQAKIKNSNSL
jgi:pyruvate,orthophosphate dikinase